MNLSLREGAPGVAVADIGAATSTPLRADADMPEMPEMVV